MRFLYRFCDIVPFSEKETKRMLILREKCIKTNRGKQRTKRENFDRISKKTTKKAQSGLRTGNAAQLACFLLHISL